MGYIINNGIHYGGTEFVENDVDIVFITGDRTASDEGDLCRMLCAEFLETGKKFGVISVAWAGNDYYTGTIVRYATASAQLIIGRVSKNYILKAKSNGVDVTMSTIQ